MKFVVTPNIFEKLPDMYVGVVITKGVDTSKDYPAIDELHSNFDYLDYCSLRL